MPNKPLNTELLDRAIIFAVKAHAGTERRGKGFPYIVHPMEAMQIVSTLTPDQEILAAAALHDTVEDTDVTIEQIRSEFGERVARLVAAETDSVVEGKDEKLSWRERKNAAIMRIAASPYEAKLVAMGDKLSNMRAIARDYRIQGDKLWDLFHAPGGMRDHEWHYRGLAWALSDLAGTNAYNEFSFLVRRVFGDPKPEHVDLSKWKESGAGYMAVSYDSLDGKRMIKLYSTAIDESIPLQELTTSWAVARLGLKTPKAVRLVTDGEKTGVEFERIQNKKSFFRAISDDPSTLEKYTLRFAELCRELHSLRCDVNSFQPTKARYFEALNKYTGLNARDKGKVANFLTSVPDCRTCIHGDLHMGNVITDGTDEWWIDLGDFSYGDPRFDLAMTYFCCNIVPDIMARDMFHLDSAQLKRVWEIFVRAYYGEGTSLEEVAQSLHPFVALQMMFLGTRGPLFPGMIKIIEETFHKK